MDALVASGWDVTLFNRGVTQPRVYESLVRLRGDRDSDTSALTGGSWDVVYDLSAFRPDQISRSAEQLANHCRHYVLVSTISVYADFSRPGITEDAPLAQFDGPIPAQRDDASYGPLKALCEKRVAELFPVRTIVRPTIIAGPHDPSDRFTYWVLRLSEPGPHVLPPSLDAPVQYVDARDLAAWMVVLGETRGTGVFNATAPPVPFRDIVDAATHVGGVALQPVQLSGEQLARENVKPWTDIPLWIPPDARDMLGMFTVDGSRAAASGLRIRPLADTVRDTLSWARGREGDDLRTGLSRAREAELVSRYGPSLT